jgi:hypothetical protein
VQYQIVQAPIPPPQTPPVVTVYAQASPPVVQQYASPTHTTTLALGPGPLCLGLARVGELMQGLRKTHVISFSHQTVRTAPVVQMASYALPAQTVTYQVVQQQPPPVQQAPPQVIYLQQMPPQKSEEAPPPPPPSPVKSSPQR